MSERQWRFGVVLAIGLAACSKPAAPPSASEGGSASGPTSAPVHDVLALAEPPGPLGEEDLARLEGLRIREIWVEAKRTPESPPPVKIKLPMGVYAVVGADNVARMSGDATGLGAAVGSQLVDEASALAGAGNQVKNAHVVLSAGNPPPTAVAAFLRSVRERIGGQITGDLSITPPSEYCSRPDAATGLDAASFVVPLALGAPALGLGEAYSAARPPIGLDLAEKLGRPYRVGFWLIGTGYLLDASERVVRYFPETAIDALSELPAVRIDTTGGLEDQAGYNYRFFTRSAVQLLGLDIPAGTDLRMRGSTPNELVATMGELSRGQWSKAGGRVYFASGFPLADGALGLEAIESYVKNGHLAPAPKVFVDEAGRSTKQGGAVLLSLHNDSVSPSLLSQLSNYVDLHVPVGRLVAVDPGDFDRFEYWVGEGKGERPAPSASRADRVRLFEFYLAPGETVSTGRLKIAGDPATVQLQTSWKLIGGDGSELEGAKQPAQPTPPEAETPSDQPPSG